MQILIDMTDVHNGHFIQIICMQIRKIPRFHLLMPEMMVNNSGFMALHIQTYYFVWDFVVNNGIVREHLITWFLQAKHFLKRPLQNVDKRNEMVANIY